MNNHQRFIAAAICACAALVCLAVLALATATARAQSGPGTPNAAVQIMEKSQAAFYYPGADMKARVVMELIAADGKKRTRVLTMLRKNQPDGQQQRYFLYFDEPGE